MNLAQMRDAVRTRIGVPSSDTFFTDQALTDLVNEALQIIAVEYDWPWLQVSTTFTTSNGTATYTPPANWARTKALVIDGYDAMSLLSLQEIREFLTTDRDVPSVYAVQADVLLLRPVPGATYTVQHDYMKVEPALAGDTDTPLMPSQYHYAIIAFASHLAYLRTGDINRATASMADAQAWLRRMADARRRSSSTLKIRVRPGGAF